MDWLQFAATVLVGVASSVITAWGQQKLTAWRLKVLESRIGRAEGNISELQQRTAALDARIS